MWKHLKNGLEEFKAAPAGERFIRTYERWQQRASNPATTVLIVAVGVILIIAGFLLGLVPGVPGIVLGVVGLALIATRSRRLARGLDWIELKCRKRSTKRRDVNDTARS
jgi:UPF0716 family protein affecting phage T7 exclusion